MDPSRYQSQIPHPRYGSHWTYRPNFGSLPPNARTSHVQVNGSQQLNSHGRIVPGNYHPTGMELVGMYPAPFRPETNTRAEPTAAEPAVLVGIHPAPSRPETNTRAEPKAAEPTGLVGIHPAPSRPETNTRAEPNAAEPAALEDKHVFVCKKDGKKFSREFRKQAKRRKKAEGESLIRIRTDIFETDEEDEANSPVLVPALPPPAIRSDRDGEAARLLKELRRTTLNKLSSYVSALQPTPDVTPTSKSHEEMKTMLRKSIDAAKEFSQGLDELNIQLDLLDTKLIPIPAPKPMQFLQMGTYVELLMRTLEIRPKTSPAMTNNIEIIQYRIARILRQCGTWNEAFILTYSQHISRDRKSLYIAACDYVSKARSDSDRSSAIRDHEKIGIQGFTKIVDRFSAIIHGEAPVPPADNNQGSNVVVDKIYRTGPPRKFLIGKFCTNPGPMRKPLEQLRRDTSDESENYSQP